VILAFDIGSGISAFRCESTLSSTSESCPTLFDKLSLCQFCTWRFRPVVHDPPSVSQERPHLAAVTTVSATWLTLCQFWCVENPPWCPRPAVRGSRKGPICQVSKQGFCHVARACSRQLRPPTRASTMKPGLLEKQSTFYAIEHLCW
jgi:hypothetical protein